MAYMSSLNTGGGVLPITTTLYGVCNTAASTAAKVVTCSDFDTITDGFRIAVLFTLGNTATSSVTININSTSAITLNNPRNIDANELVDIIYINNSFYLFHTEFIKTTNDGEQVINNTSTNTPITFKGGTTGVSYIRFRDSDNTYLGRIGMKSNATPCVNDGSNDKRIFTDADGYVFQLNSGTAISATEEAHADLNNYTSSGTYYYYSNTAGYVDNKPVVSNNRFTLIVMRIGANATCLRQIFMRYSDELLYIRRSSDSGVTWSGWKTMATTSDLVNYIKSSADSAQTIENTSTASGVGLNIKTGYTGYAGITFTGGETVLGTLGMEPNGTPIVRYNAVNYTLAKLSDVVKLTNAGAQVIWNTSSNTILYLKGGNDTGDLVWGGINNSGTVLGYMGFSAAGTPEVLNGAGSLAGYITVYKTTRIKQGETGLIEFPGTCGYIIRTATSTGASLSTAIGVGYGATSSRNKLTTLALSSSITYTVSDTVFGVNIANNSTQDINVSYIMF